MFARVLGRTLVIILGSLLVVEVVIGALVIGSHGDIGVDFLQPRGAEPVERFLGDGHAVPPPGRDDPMLEHGGDGPKRRVGGNGALTQHHGLRTGDVDHRRGRPRQPAPVEQRLGR